MENYAAQRLSSEAIKAYYQDTPRRLPIIHGWYWIRDAWGLLSANMAMWLLAFLAYFAISIALNLIPGIGQLAGALLAFNLSAGYLYCAHHQKYFYDFDISELFAGFKRQFLPLFLMGCIFCVYGLLLGAGILLTLLALIFVIPLLMVVMFAPHLIFFNELTPVQAMKTSFNAVLYNMLPFSLNAVLMLLLGCLSILPLGLGLIVFLPLMVLTYYTAYADIFAATDQEQTTRLETEIKEKPEESDAELPSASKAIDSQMHSDMPAPSATTSDTHAADKNKEAGDHLSMDR